MTALSYILINATYSKPSLNVTRRLKFEEHYCYKLKLLKLGNYFMGLITPMRLMHLAWSTSILNIRNIDEL